jgi:hypothetical protein
MADTPVTAKVHKALDVHRSFTAQIAFNNKTGHRGTQVGHFRLSQVLDDRIRRNTRRRTNLLGARVPDAIYRRQTNHYVFV